MGIFSGRGGQKLKPDDDAGGSETERPARSAPEALQAETSPQEGGPSPVLGAAGGEAEDGAAPSGAVGADMASSQPAPEAEGAVNKPADGPEASDGESSPDGDVSPSNGADERGDASKDSDVDDLMSLFTEDEVGDPTFSALLDSLEDVTGDELAEQCREVTARLRERRR